MNRFVLYSALVSLMSLSASAQDAVSPDPGSGLQEQSGAPAAEKDVGPASAEQVAAEPGTDRKPAAEQNSAPRTAEPDPQAPAPAAAAPNPENRKPAASAAGAPATAAPGSKAQKHAAVKPRAKRPNHAARRGPRGPSYHGGHRRPRYSYRWAYSPWYGFYRYRPGYYTYYGYYRGYR